MILGVFACFLFCKTAGHSVLGCVVFGWFVWGDFRMEKRGLCDVFCVGDSLGIMDPTMGELIRCGFYNTSERNSGFYNGCTCPILLCEPVGFYDTSE